MWKGVMIDESGMVALGEILECLEFPGAWNVSWDKTSFHMAVVW